MASNMYVRLCTACVAGNVEEVGALIATDSLCLLATDKDGWIPLHHAVWSGRETVVHVILAPSTNGISAADKRGRTPLHLAALKGHVAIVKSLIAAGASVVNVDDDKRSPLHALLDENDLTVTLSLIAKAADDQRSWLLGDGSSSANIISTKNEIFQTLMTTNVDLEGVDRLRDTPLHLAIRAWLEDIALALVAAHVSVNVQNKVGSTPLHEAARNGLLSVLTAVLSIDSADVMALNREGQSALFVAIHNSRDAAAMALIEAKSNVNIADNNGKTPILMAAIKDNLPIVVALISAGADVSLSDKNKNTALLQSLKKKNTEMVIALLDAGADVRVSDSDGYTPMHYAAVNGNVLVVKALIAAGAIFSGNVNNSSCSSILHIAIKNRQEAVSQLLIENIAKFDRKDVVTLADKLAYTPLHYAAMRCLESVVDKLIDAGADVFCVDSKGRTPLHMATHTSSRIVKTLLRANANVEAVDHGGSTPLVDAVIYASVDSQTVEALIEFGASLSTSLHVDTPLHVAVRNGNECVIEVLLNSGVDVQATDKNGRTALDLANIGSKTRIIRLLQAQLSLQ